MKTDRFYNNPPEDNFTPWCEDVVELIPNEIFEENEDFFLESKQFNQWLNKLYRMSPEDASKVCIRAYKIYRNKI